MKRGAVLFAYNTDTVDYYRMAVYTAKRINRFLDLPVTIITDESSITDTQYQFDRVIIREPDRTNVKKNQVWINKGRYQVYDLTPYDETLVLDTDYMINSTQLLQTFEYPSDFVCHRQSSSVVIECEIEDTINNQTQPLWATVMTFRKTQRVREIFNMIQMIQENYVHYSRVYGFLPYTYRNDYALTIALKTVNGHLEHSSDYLAWDLWNVESETKLYRDGDTEYTAVYTDASNKHHYIKIADRDFHVLDKQNFMELSQ